MKTLRTIDSLRREVAMLCAEHIANRLKLNADGPVSLRPGVDALQQAQASVSRWQRAACEIFLLLVESDDYITKREVATRLGLAQKVVDDVWSRTIGGTRINVYAAAHGEPVEMMLFRYRKERSFAQNGKNELGEMVTPGIKLLIGRKRNGYRDGQNVFATTKNVTKTFTDNLANATDTIAAGTKREAADWERQRTEIEAQRVRGHQVEIPLVPQKTGTDGGE